MKKILLLFLLSFITLLCFGQSYIGSVKKTVNLRKGPGIEEQVISSLKKGRQIFIISLNPVNGFYNVIDIQTDTEGYIYKSFVAVGEEIQINEKGLFTPNGTSTTYNPEIEVFNNTRLTLTLKLNDDRFTFSPKEKRKLILTSGSYNYRASAPGVIPNVGEEILESSVSYRWQFYIVTDRRNFR